jgi:D-sedoheptulose 7-phosphate isomerase
LRLEPLDHNHRDATMTTFEWLCRSHDAIEAAIEDHAFVEAIGVCAKVIGGAILADARIFIAGNGGSAAQAQHFAAELVGRYALERRALPAIALGTDPATLTAIANDYGYERVFERQLLALGRTGDVFVAISTSGRSANILNAVEAAHLLDIPVIGMTGRPGDPLIGRCHGAIVAPATETALVQQLHLVAVHAICGTVERLCVNRQQMESLCQPSR